MLNAHPDLILIDSGAGKSFQTLVANIEELGFNPKTLKSIIVTHAHIDHIGALHQFQDELGVQIIAHQLDAEVIELGKGICAELYGVDYIPCQVDLRLQGSEESLEYGDLELKIVHIPGHTPGSIAAYVDKGKRILFGQDVHGPYYPEWGADPGQAKVSLQRIIDLKADILCEGHFGVYQPADVVEAYIREYLDTL
jgi:glyoxylase-like metal-dependent hydrolase (beta-lactamase superfamily II)